MGRRFAVLLTAEVLAAVVVASAVGPAAGAAPKVRVVTKTFSSPTSINTPSSGPGAPYPSIRNVSFGRGAKILDVNLALRGYVHTRADDAEVLLVAPGDKRIVAMSDVGGAADFSNVTLTLDDEATGAVPDNGPVTSGRFVPSQGTEAIDGFPAPAPRGPYPRPLSTFDGSNPSGSWLLYVFDDQDFDGNLVGLGQFVGGWSLKIKARVRR